MGLLKDLDKTNKITDQLKTIPAILGQLGLDISEAQKAMTLDFLTSVNSLLSSVAVATGATKEGGGGAAGGDKKATPVNMETLAALMKMMGPSRYQFTETTFEFRVDIAQSVDIAAGASLGVGTGAVSLNASVSVGFGYDYRAAARITSVLHAIPPDPEVMTALLTRVKELALTGDKLTLPTTAAVDNNFVEVLSSLLGVMSGGEKKKE